MKKLAMSMIMVIALLVSTLPNTTFAGQKNNTAINPAGNTANENGKAYWKQDNLLQFCEDENDYLYSEIDSLNERIADLEKQLEESVNSAVMLGSASVPIENNNNCLDPDVNYESVNLAYLEARWSSKANINILRIRMQGDTIDWTKFNNGLITVEVMLNDKCEYTYNVSDEIGYFLLTEKDFEGYRLTDYDYPDTDVYAGKIRVTTEKGINKHYVYINNVDVHNLVGSTVNVKIKLIQNGEVIQAFTGSRVMTEVIN